MDGDPGNQEKAKKTRPRLEIELPPPIPAGRRTESDTTKQKDAATANKPALTSKPPSPHPVSSSAKSILVANPVTPIPADQPKEQNQPHGDGFEPIHDDETTGNKPSNPKPPAPTNELHGCLVAVIIAVAVVAVICLVAGLSGEPATQNVSQTAYSANSQDAANSQSALNPQSSLTPTPTPLPPHVVLDADGKREPAPGYQWVNNDPNDFRVIPKVTPTPTPIPLPPHVVLDADGKREPAPGYQWANDDPNDLRVIPKVTPTPTPTPIPLPPHVVLNARGAREPAPGYQWANDDPNDFRVIPKATPMPIHTATPTPKLLPPRRVALSPAAQALISTDQLAIAKLERELEGKSKTLQEFRTKVATESLNSWGHFGRLQKLQVLEGECNDLSWKIGNLHREIENLRNGTSVP